MVSYFHAYFNLAIQMVSRGDAGAGHIIIMKSEMGPVEVPWNVMTVFLKYENKRFIHEAGLIPRECQSLFCQWEHKILPN